MSNNDGDAFKGVLVVVLLVLGGIAALVIWIFEPAPAPSHTADYIRKIEAHGFTEVHGLKLCLLCCDKNDTWRATFKATAPNGRPVSGQICEGLIFKGATVRLD